MNKALSVETNIYIAKCELCILEKIKHDDFLYLGREFSKNQESGEWECDKKWDEYFTNEPFTAAIPVVIRNVIDKHDSVFNPIKQFYVCLRHFKNIIDNNDIKINFSFDEKRLNHIVEKLNQKEV